jgi:hypothetical protein
MSWVWWCTPIILAFEKLMENCSPAWGTQQDPVSKKTKNKTKKIILCSYLRMVFKDGSIDGIFIVTECSVEHIKF